MSTFGLVLLVLAAAATATRRVWGAAPQRSPSSTALNDALRVLQQHREYRRLRRRDPAAADALLDQMEREREDHYRVLRERAARDPEAAREFVEVATGRLQDLRQGAKTFRRKASRDPVAGLVATDLEQEIQRVENDLRCVRRPAG